MDDKKQRRQQRMSEFCNMQIKVEDVNPDVVFASETHVFYVGIFWKKEGSLKFVHYCNSFEQATDHAKTLVRLGYDSDRSEITIVEQNRKHYKYQTTPTPPTEGEK